MLTVTDFVCEGFTVMRVREGVYELVTGAVILVVTLTEYVIRLRECVKETDGVFERVIVGLSVPVAEGKRPAILT